MVYCRNTHKISECENNMTTTNQWHPILLSAHVHNKNVSIKTLNNAFYDGHVTSVEDHICEIRMFGSGTFVYVAMQYIVSAKVM